jgi:hypothetical protein
MSRRVNANPPRTIAKSTVIESVTQADIDQEAVKARLLEVLRRESINLMTESTEGRLDRDRSVALVNYLKFLNQLDEAQNEKLSELTDEELDAATKKST